MRFKSKEVLEQNIKDFEKSLKWLQKAIERCKKLKSKNFEELSDSEIESIEALFSRYSRCVDFLINRVLRSIELSELGSAIISNLDLVIKAEKKGFVNNYEELIALKDLRNELAHEYVGDMVMEKFEEVFESAEKLLKISQKVLDYAKFKILNR